MLEVSKRDAIMRTITRFDPFFYFPSIGRVTHQGHGDGCTPKGTYSARINRQFGFPLDASHPSY
jgi:hypothetical protein